MTTGGFPSYPNGSPNTNLRNKITVDGWTCYDGPNPDRDSMGCEWIFDTLEGWFGGLDPRTETVDNPFADGAFDGYLVPFGARTVTVSGTVVAPYRSHLQPALDRLASVLAGNARRAELRVMESAREIPFERSCQVRLAGPTLIQRTGPTTATWSISMLSASVLRYSTLSQSIALAPYKAGTGRTYNLTFNRTYGPPGNSGRTTIFSNGTAPTWPTLTFEGGDHPRLQQVGGAYIELNLDLNGLPPVVVDNEHRTVLMGGQDRRRYLTPGSKYFQIPNGWSDYLFTTRDGKGQVIIAWRDAWI